MKGTTTTNGDVEIAKVVATHDFVNSPDTETRLRCDRPAAWQSAETLMLEFGGVTKKAGSMEEYFTNDFLPAKWRTFREPRRARSARRAEAGD